MVCVGLLEGQGSEGVGGSIGGLAGGEVSEK
jgi:hypothetical protein